MNYNTQGIDSAKMHLHQNPPNHETWNVMDGEPLMYTYKVQSKPYEEHDQMKVT